MTWTLVAGLVRVDQKAVLSFAFLYWQVWNPAVNLGH